jgi:hypothetical protein
MIVTDVELTDLNELNVVGINATFCFNDIREQNELINARRIRMFGVDFMITEVFVHDNGCFVNYKVSTYLNNLGEAQRVFNELRSLNNMSQPDIVTNNQKFIPYYDDIETKEIKNVIKENFKVNNALDFIEI